MFSATQFMLQYVLKASDDTVKCQNILSVCYLKSNIVLLNIRVNGKGFYHYCLL